MGVKGWACFITDTFHNDTEVKTPCQCNKPASGKKLKANYKSQESSKADCDTRQHDTKKGWFLGIPELPPFEFQLDFKTLLLYPSIYAHIYRY